MSWIRLDDHGIVNALCGDIDDIGWVVESEKLLCGWKRIVIEN